MNWTVKGGIATTYSPSHAISPRKTARGLQVKVAGKVAPGPFRLSVLRKKKKDAVASLLTHPEEGQNAGRDLLVIAPPAREDGVARLKREVTVVIDRSGSMAGEKLDKARAAAAQVVEVLDEG